MYISSNNIYEFQVVIFSGIVKNQKQNSVNNIIALTWFSWVFIWPSWDQNVGLDKKQALFMVSWLSNILGESGKIARESQADRLNILHVAFFTFWIGKRLTASKFPKIARFCTSSLYYNAKLWFYCNICNYLKKEATGYVGTHITCRDGESAVGLLCLLYGGDSV